VTKKCNNLRSIFGTGELGKSLPLTKSNIKNRIIKLVATTASFVLCGDYDPVSLGCCPQKRRRRVSKEACNLLGTMMTIRRMTTINPMMHILIFISFHLRERC
jgi:hypothetical protein